MESVKKPGKDGESTGKAEPEKAPCKTLEAAGWKATTKGITTNWHVIGLSDEGAWAHNRFNVKLPNSPCCTTCVLCRSSAIPSPGPSEAKHPKHRRAVAPESSPSPSEPGPPGVPSPRPVIGAAAGTTGRGVGSGGT